MIWLGLLVLLLAAVAVYWTLFYCRQNRLLFPGHRLPVPASIPYATEWLNLPFGKVEMAFLPAAGSAPRPTVLVAHGQLGLIDSWLERLSQLQSLGYNCLLVEFPGYGRSQGQCSASSLRQTFCAAYDWLLQRPEVDRQQIIGLGRSMGGGVISLLALHRPLQCLWLMSTYTSLRPFVARRGIPGWLLKDPLDNLARIKQHGLPVLVLHGEADDIIPVSHGKQLAGRAEHSQLVLEPGDHDRCPADWAAFWRTAVNFQQSLKIRQLP